MVYGTTLLYLQFGFGCLARRRTVRAVLNNDGHDSNNTGISAPGSARYFLALLYIVLLGVRLSQKYSTLIPYIY